MKRLVLGLLLSSLVTAMARGQEADRSLHRIGLGLEQPLPTLRARLTDATTQRRTLGIFTMVPPERPGELVRISVPVGELVTRAFNGVAVANRRRHEAAARRQVAAALEEFARQRPRSPNR